MQRRDTLGEGLFTLPSTSAFLSKCPQFRLLVLGNLESTKMEIFSNVFGVKMDKASMTAAFSNTHDVSTPIDTGENSRLALHTSTNFGNGDKAAYEAVADFLRSHQLSARIQDRIHCVWYCVSCDTDREIDGLEADFFQQLPTIAPGTPTVLLFTKYEELILSVKQDFLRDKPSGLSNMTASHILRDLTTKHFDKHIGQRWQAITTNSRVSQICVATEDEGRPDMEILAAHTLTDLAGQSEKLVFAAAQRASPAISTRVCADIAAEYFTVDTGHARKRSGVDSGEILHDYLDKCIQLFNFADPDKVLLRPGLLMQIMASVLEAEELGFIKTIVDSGGPSLIDSLSPHDRACLLAQVLAAIVLFFHQLAESQWLHREPVPELTLHVVDRELRGIRSGRDRKLVLETIEASPIFTTCNLTTQVSDLILKAVEHGQKGAKSADTFVAEDESELQEISLSFVNDQGPDDMVLPCGMTVLTLN